MEFDFDDYEEDPWSDSEDNFSEPPFTYISIIDDESERVYDQLETLANSLGSTTLLRTAEGLRADEASLRKMQDHLQEMREAMSNLGERMERAENLRVRGTISYQDSLQLDLAEACADRLVAAKTRLSDRILEFKCSIQHRKIRKQVEEERKEEEGKKEARLKREQEIEELLRSGIPQAEVDRMRALDDKRLREEEKQLEKMRNKRKMEEEAREKEEEDKHKSVRCEKFAKRFQEQFDAAVRHAAMFVQAREERNRELDEVIAAHTRAMEERYRNARNTRTGTVAEMIEVGLLQPTIVTPYVVRRPGTEATSAPAAGYIPLGMIPLEMAHKQVDSSLHPVFSDVQLALSPAPPERVEEILRAASSSQEEATGSASQSHETSTDRCISKTVTESSGEPGASSSVASGTDAALDVVVLTQEMSKLMVQPNSVSSNTPNVAQETSLGMSQGLPPPSWEQGIQTGEKKPVIAPPAASHIPSQIPDSLSGSITGSTSTPDVSLEAKFAQLSLTSRENQPIPIQQAPNTEALNVSSRNSPWSAPGFRPGLFQTISPGFGPGVTRSLSTGMSPGFSSSFSPGLMSRVAPEYIPGTIHRITEGVPLSVAQRLASPTPNFGVIGDRSRLTSQPSTPQNSSQNEGDPVN